MSSGHNTYKDCFGSSAPEPPADTSHIAKASDENGETGIILAIIIFRYQFTK